MAASRSKHFWSHVQTDVPPVLRVGRADRSRLVTAREETSASIEARFDETNYRCDFRNGSISDMTCSDSFTAAQYRYR
jgi:hypothetical protein